MRIHNKLNGSETVLEVICALSAGNPGAVMVCAQLYKEDPLTLFTLDQEGVYGEDIWLIYKDLCHEDLGLMIMAFCTPGRPILAQLRALTISEVSPEGNK